MRLLRPLLLILFFVLGAIVGWFLKIEQIDTGLLLLALFIVWAILSRKIVCKSGSELSKEEKLYGLIALILFIVAMFLSFVIASLMT